MSNGNVMIAHLIAGLIKQTEHNFIDCTYKKCVNIFPNHV